ncbi:unnamed protein product [Amoebophrya sp. A25]|nr:unnamed protein product [Amoebophrya sp. A25]|eukprot:GSA25T00026510001.1
MHASTRKVSRGNIIGHDVDVGGEGDMQPGSRDSARRGVVDEGSFDNENGTSAEKMSREILVSSGEASDSYSCSSTGSSTCSTSSIGSKRRDNEDDGQYADSSIGSKRPDNDWQYADFRKVLRKTLEFMVPRKMRSSGMQRTPFVDTTTHGDSHHNQSLVVREIARAVELANYAENSRQNATASSVSSKIASRGPHEGSCIPKRIAVRVWNMRPTTLLKNQRESGAATSAGRRASFAASVEDREDGQDEGEIEVLLVKNFVASRDSFSLLRVLDEQQSQIQRQTGDEVTSSSEGGIKINKPRRIIVVFATTTGFQTQTGGATGATSSTSALTLCPRLADYVSLRLDTRHWNQVDVDHRRRGTDTTRSIKNQMDVNHQTAHEDALALRTTTALPSSSSSSQVINEHATRILEVLCSSSTVDDDNEESQSMTSARRIRALCDAPLILPLLQYIVAHRMDDVVESARTSTVGTSSSGGKQGKNKSFSASNKVSDLGVQEQLRERCDALIAQQLRVMLQREEDDEQTTTRSLITTSTGANAGNCTLYPRLDLDFRDEVITLRDANAMINKSSEDKEEEQDVVVQRERRGRLVDSIVRIVHACVLRARRWQCCMTYLRRVPEELKNEGSTSTTSSSGAGEGTPELLKPSLKSHHILHAVAEEEEQVRSFVEKIVHSSCSCSWKTSLGHQESELLAEKDEINEQRAFEKMTKSVVHLRGGIRLACENFFSDDAHYANGAPLRNGIGSAGEEDENEVAASHDMDEAVAGEQGEKTTADEEEAMSVTATGNEEGQEKRSANKRKEAEAEGKKVSEDARSAVLQITDEIGITVVIKNSQP